MLKFDHFIVTPILREIKCWRIQMVHNCFFLPILEVLNFDLWYMYLSNFQGPNLQNFKVQSVQNCQNDIFGPFEFSKIGFHLESDSEWQ